MLDLRSKAVITFKMTAGNKGGTLPTNISRERIKKYEFQYPEVIIDEYEDCERKLAESCNHISPILNHFDNQ